MPELIDNNDLDWVEAAGNLTGSRKTSDNVLKQWTRAEAWAITSTTRDSDGVVTSAGITWPDGVTGTYTLTTKNGAWLCADAFTVTHVVGAVTRTVTQAAVTRNSAGEITVLPALTVA